MTRRLLALVAVPLAVAACSSNSKSSSTSSGSSSASSGGTKTINITLSDKGCEPRQISTPAGPTTFEVKNDGSAAVTEFEVLDGGRIIGEVETAIPGSDKSFSLTLSPGSYTTKCSGGAEFEEGTLEATGDAASGTSAGADSKDAAVHTYRE